MSPRPKRQRKLKEPPHITGFIPENEDFNPDNAIILLYEEYEALKLADYENLSQLEAAKRLDVSRPTFTRIYDSALKKVAKALVEQKRLLIGGGKVVFNEKWYVCNNCGAVFKVDDNTDNTICPVCKSENIVEVQNAETNAAFRGRYRHRGRHTAGMGNTGNCICPKCDYKVTHQPGVPCNSHLCPNCNIRMVRENSFHHIELLKKRKK
jgi:predicted DNA-binding protein (UPF0251 family)